MEPNGKLSLLSTLHALSTSLILEKMNVYLLTWYIQLFYCFSHGLLMDIVKSISFYMVFFFINYYKNFIKILYFWISHRWANVIVIR